MEDGKKEAIPILILIYSKWVCCSIYAYARRESKSIPAFPLLNIIHEGAGDLISPSFMMVIGKREFVLPKYSLPPMMIIMGKAKQFLQMIHMIMYRSSQVKTK